MRARACTDLFQNLLQGKYYINLFACKNQHPRSNHLGEINQNHNGKFHPCVAVMVRRKQLKYFSFPNLLVRLWLPKL